MDGLAAKACTQIVLNVLPRLAVATQACLVLNLDTRDKYQMKPGVSL